MARFAPVLMVILCCAGCAAPASQEILVITDPAGARCTLLRDGKPIATISPTPGSVLIEKTKHGVDVVCDKPGYARTAGVPPVVTAPGGLKLAQAWALR